MVLWIKPLAMISLTTPNLSYSLQLLLSLRADRVNASLHKTHECFSCRQNNCKEKNSEAKNKMIKQASLNKARYIVGNSCETIRPCLIKTHSCFFFKCMPCCELVANCLKYFPLASSFIFLFLLYSWPVTATASHWHKQSSLNKQQTDPFLVVLVL